MKARPKRYYYVYILTNGSRKILLTGTTTDIMSCAQFYHLANTRNYKRKEPVFLVYWEVFANMTDAVNRESDLQNMPVRKKKQLINEFNPGWKQFHNAEIEERTESMFQIEQ